MLRVLASVAVPMTVSHCGNHNVDVEPLLLLRKFVFLLGGNSNVRNCFDNSGMNASTLFSRSEMVWEVSIIFVVDGNSNCDL